MLLKEYIYTKINGMKRQYPNGCRVSFRIDMVNSETGEVYFSGDISWIKPEFVSEKLEFVKDETSKNYTIWFKEIK